MNTNDTVEALIKIWLACQDCPESLREIRGWVSLLKLEDAFFSHPIFRSSEKANFPANQPETPSVRESLKETLKRWGAIRETE